MAVTRLVPRAADAGWLSQVDRGRAPVYTEVLCEAFRRLSAIDIPDLGSSSDGAGKMGCPFPMAAGKKMQSRCASAA
jgi:hypothetical protein